MRPTRLHLRIAECQRLSASEVQYTLLGFYELFQWHSERRAERQQAKSNRFRNSIHGTFRTRCQKRYYKEVVMEQTKKSSTAGRFLRSALMYIHTVIHNSAVRCDTVRSLEHKSVAAECEVQGL